MYECNFLFWPENSKIRVCILQILARLIVPMAGFASVTICAPVLTVSVGPIARIRLVLSTVKMAAFAPCPITNANVGTATMELDVTKSEYYKFKEEEIFQNRCMKLMNDRLMQILQHLPIKIPNLRSSSLCSYLKCF